MVGNLVRMRDEGRGLHLLDEKAFVAVLDAQAALGIDDAALALDDLRVEGQVRDPVGLEVEHQVERAARNPVLVHGDVVAGERVVRTALRFHEPVEFAGLTLARAVEHHVLEEMREAGDAGHFVAAADAHPVVERDVRDVAVRPDDDLHAVRERGRTHLVAPGTRAAGAGLVAPPPRRSRRRATGTGRRRAIERNFDMRHLGNAGAQL